MVWRLMVWWWLVVWLVVWWRLVVRGVVRVLRMHQVVPHALVQHGRHHWGHHRA